MARAQHVLDSRALEMAAGVAEVQQRHEDECTRRYAVLDGSLLSLHAKLDESRREREDAQRRVYGMLWKTAGATITLLMLIIGYLLTHAAPWQTLGGTH